MQKNSLVAIALGTGLLTLVSCGNTDKNSTKSSAEQLQEQETQGLYRGSLTALNTSVSGTTSGVLTLKIEGDEVTAEMTVDGAPAQVTHIQYIRAGGACPETTADINADSFIDAVEAEAISGKVYIPLDSNLNSQAEGLNYPIAHSSGKYRYSEAGSLTNMIADLFSTDENLEDSLIKLEMGQELNLSGRAVMIHGVAEDSVLPETVLGSGGKTAQASLPIACGILTRVESTDPVTASDGGKN